MALLIYCKSCGKTLATVSSHPMNKYEEGCTHFPERKLVQWSKNMVHGSPNDGYCYNCDSHYRITYDEFGTPNLIKIKDILADSVLA